MSENSKTEFHYVVRSVQGHSLNAVAETLNHNGKTYLMYFSLYRGDNWEYVGVLGVSQMPPSLETKIKLDGFRKSRAKAAGFYQWWRDDDFRG